MKLNKVKIENANPALLSLIDNYRQVLTLDANFFIPPDRSKENKKIPTLDFNLFKKHWLTPLILTFPYLSIHQAVYDEFQTGSVRDFVTQKISGNPSSIMLLRDEELDSQEKIVRNSLEISIARPTRYSPGIDNKDDRGEVKSLAHIATKGYLYFCSHDSNALRLIDDASELQTNLDNVLSIRTYEIQYYLLRMEMAEKGFIRSLYKYMYYLTESDKKHNLSWEEFCNGMDTLYLDAIKKASEKPTKLIL
ncbi:hypothetical protein [Aneurinibacillus aneurinilyticus]|uniref:Uncharacterized protein n=1 Tax=Aneurinibacillus aneurinilyticus ATCC 12856 TaxID=649747 RepID=U1YE52_ANEAE|nr:hypothetical protein [Aneurinibacillus aneurinilyticus]ERI10362.1 hypothetical protein HMPREF0083_01545 [Aneurinibacillus aneurinilyticus ATCC 12856]MED0709599.1 hypothetical protein [Aneurinibacillus aneurinilyticus]MED0726636.1 hypothetical protein [Aneurinibacillus aneurinilyticus]MED0730300.1 hypothetical protein [Aneurinibacillus aneurinilyticus]MED0744285.1 hypothetical protein [Aneurinibacillus aneurinilyticus]